MTRISQPPHQSQTNELRINGNHLNHHLNLSYSYSSTCHSPCFGGGRFGTILPGVTSYASEGVSGSIHPACILRTISNNSNSVYIAINCHQSNGVGLALSCGHGDFWFWVSEKMTISVGLVWRAKIRKNVWVCRIYLRKIGKPTDMVAAAIKLLTTFNMDNI